MSDGCARHVRCTPGARALAPRRAVEPGSRHHVDGLPLVDLLRTVTLAPSRVLGLAAGRLSVGAPADVVLFDPNAPVSPAPIGSAFDGRRLQGRVLATWVDGARA